MVQSLTSVYLLRSSRKYSRGLPTLTKSVKFDIYRVLHVLSYCCRIHDISINNYLSWCLIVTQWLFHSKNFYKICLWSKALFSTEQSADTWEAEVSQLHMCHSNDCAVTFAPGWPNISAAEVTACEYYYQLSVISLTESYAISYITNRLTLEIYVHYIEHHIYCMD